MTGPGDGVFLAWSPGRPGAVLLWRRGRFVRVVETCQARPTGVPHPEREDNESADPE